MLLLEQLIFEYVLPFAKPTELQFPESFNIAILGKWHQQPERSNYTGKSSFAELISLLLYGKCRAKYQSEIPNDRFNKVGMVEGIINVDNVKYTIKRSFTLKSSTLSIACDKRPDLQDYQKAQAQVELDLLIGLDYDEFIQSCFFTQGDISKLMTAQPAAKLEMLNSWMAIEDWDVELEDSKVKYSETFTAIELIKDSVADEAMQQDRHSHLESEIASIRSDIESKRLLLESGSIVLKEKQSALSSAEQNLTAIDDDTKLDELLAEFADFHTEDVYNKDIADSKAEIEKLNNDVAHYRKLQLGLSDNEQLIIKIGKKVDKLDKERDDLITKRDEISRSGILAGVESAMCPILKEKCERLVDHAVKASVAKNRHDTLKVVISKLDNRISDYVTTLEEIEAEIIEIKAADESIKTTKHMIQIQHNSIDYYKKQIEKQKEVAKEINELTVARNQDNIDKLQKEQADCLLEVEALEDEKQDAQKELDSQNQFLGGLVHEQEQIESKLKDIDKKKIELPKLKKRLAALKFIKQMYGKSGIRQAQLKNFMGVLEDGANKILDSLDAQLNIEITTERDLTSWEDSCLNCKYMYSKGTKQKKCPECDVKRERKKTEELDIRIINRDSVRSFHAESGAAKVLASLAIRLSVLALRRQITGTSVGLLIIDEVCAMFDSQNRHSFYKLLASYMQNELGFQQIFSISHFSDNDLVEDGLLVTRRQNYSTVEWM